MESNIGAVVSNFYVKKGDRKKIVRINRCGVPGCYIATSLNNHTSHYSSTSIDFLFENANLDIGGFWCNDTWIVQIAGTNSFQIEYRNMYSKIFYEMRADQFLETFWPFEGKNCFKCKTSRRRWKNVNFRDAFCWTCAA